MFDITIQRAIKAKAFPNAAQLKKWAKTALKNKASSAEITIRIVDKQK